MADGNTATKGAAMTICADPQCDRLSVPQDVPVVADVETGAVYCDAMCHHSHHYGVRPPVTLAEETALERARAWMAKYR
jgi:hypothetical protein